MSDYTDSDFWAGSPTDSAGVWIRNPQKDGEEFPGGGLNEGMRLLDQARKEVQAIENVLGVDVAGSRANLETRLQARVSPSGLQRGMTYMLRSPNAVPGTFNRATNWYDRGSIFMQFNVDGPYTGVTSATITYPQAYFTAIPPLAVVACMVSRADQRLSQCQLQVTTIGITTFTVTFRGWRTDGSWGVIDTNRDVMWCAIGGFPAA